MGRVGAFPYARHKRNGCATSRASPEDLEDLPIYYSDRSYIISQLDFYNCSSPQDLLARLQSPTKHPGIRNCLLVLKHTHLLDTGGLEGGSQDELVHVIANTLADAVPSLSADDLSDQLQTVLRVPGAHVDWGYSLLENVASQEAKRSKVREYVTGDIYCMLVAAGRISEARPGLKNSELVSTYLEVLVREMRKRLRSVETRDVLNMRMFLPLAEACAALFASDPPSPPSYTVKLLNTVAIRVRHQASKRRFRLDTFTPKELVRFLELYAVLGIQSVEVSSMLEAFVPVKELQDFWIEYESPEDAAAVLRAYATVSHSAVAAPELLMAVSNRLRQKPAQMHQALFLDQYDESHIYEWLPCPYGQPPNMTWSVGALVNILDAHAKLGFSPDVLTMHAVLPGIRRQLASAHPRDVVRLLELLEIVNYNPGAGMVTLFVARVADAEKHGNDSTSDLYSRALRAATALNCGLTFP
jgi:hypothetical protein